MKKFQNVSLFQDAGFASTLVTGYMQLYSSGLLKRAGNGFDKKFAKITATNVFNISSNTAQLSPLVRHVAAKMLSLVLHIGLSSTDLHGFLSDSSLCITQEPAQGSQDSLDSSMDSSQLEDKQEEKQQVMNSGQTKGSAFINNFKLLLSTYLLANFEEHAPLLMGAAHQNREVFNLLIDITDLVLRESRKMWGDKMKGYELFLPSILKNFPDAFVSFQHEGAIGSEIFTAEYTDRLSTALSFLDKLLSLDSTAMLDSTQRVFPMVLNIYLQALSREAPVAIKKKALSMLPWFLSGPSLNIATSNLLHAQAPVLSTLSRFIVSPPFPATTKSAELDQKDMTFHQYTQLLEELLNALVVSKSFALLKTLLPILREENHVLKDKILKASADVISAVNQPGF